MTLSSGARLIAIGLFLGLLLYIGYVLRSTLLLIYVSMVFAIILSPCVSWIQSWRVRQWSPARGFALLIMLASILIAIGIFLAFAVPPIVNDGQQLTRDIPNNMHSLRESVTRLPFGHAMADKLNENRIQSWIETAIRHVFTVVQGMMGGLMAVFTLVLLTCYFILDGKRAFHWGISIAPQSMQERLASTLSRGGECNDGSTVSSS